MTIFIAEAVSKVFKMFGNSWVNHLSHVWTLFNCMCYFGVYVETSLPGYILAVHRNPGTGIREYAGARPYLSDAQRCFK